MINVLLADDQRLVCEGLCNLLKSHEDLCVIGLAHNGREAIDLAKSLNPDVLLLDIQMPEMDGLEAASHLQYLLPDLKILILTTFKNQDYLTRAISLGVKGYILKNTPPEELAQAIRLVHRGHTHFSPGIMEQLVPLLSPLANPLLNQNSFNGLSHQSSNLIKTITSEVGEESNHRIKIGAVPQAIKSGSSALSNSSSNSFKLENLTPREVEIIKLIGQGFTNREIAQTLGISEQTVKNHVSSILRRLQLRDRTQVALWATRMFAL